MTNGHEFVGGRHEISHDSLSKMEGKTDEEKRQKVPKAKDKKFKNINGKIVELHVEAHDW